MQTIKTYSQDTGIEKCTMPIMKSGKIQITEGTELPNQERIRILGEKRNYKSLGIVEAVIKQAKMKEKKSSTKLLKSKLYNRNHIKRVNTWAVPFVRYLKPFLKWTKSEHRQLDQRTKKLMTMRKAVHRRDYIDRLYASRKKEKGLFNIEDSRDTSIQRLEDNIKEVKGY